MSRCVICMDPLEEWNTSACDQCIEENPDFDEGEHDAYPDSPAADDPTAWEEQCPDCGGIAIGSEMKTGGHVHCPECGWFE